MRESTLDTAIAEAQRFIARAEKLKRCTSENNVKNNYGWSKEFGYDSGISKLKRAPSKTRAAVNRACIDLRNALSDVTQGR